jgi:two-component system, cell cycle sensor histidine kinase and response regulator CckA
MTMPTILLVEDEPPIRRLVNTALSREGYEVVTASNGREACEIFDREADRIDLVITDMRMPEMDGADMIRELRQRRATVKVLCITGYHPNIPEDLSARALQKPFTREDLLKAVRAALAETASR